MKFKGIYIYYILLAASLIAFMVSDEPIILPAWGTLIGVLFLGWIAMDQSWKAFKRQGRAGILVSLKPSEGGHSTIHPDDISMAMNKNEAKDSPNFLVFATGGFVHGGVEWQGQENFVVCPPEQIDSTGPAFICYTKLRRVLYEELPDYVQEELKKLKFFSLMMVRANKNLWFGMTSKRDGTTTSKNLALESKFLDQTYIINSLKDLLKDKNQAPEERRSRKGEQIVVNIPER